MDEIQQSQLTVVPLPFSHHSVSFTSSSSSLPASSSSSTSSSMSSHPSTLHERDNGDDTAKKHSLKSDRHCRCPSHTSVADARLDTHRGPEEDDDEDKTWEVNDKDSTFTAAHISTVTDDDNAASQTHENPRTHKHRCRCRCSPHPEASLEGIHDTLHNLLGGGGEAEKGHMGSPAVAGAFYVRLLLLLLWLSVCSALSFRHLPVLIPRFVTFRPTPLFVTSSFYSLVSSLLLFYRTFTLR